MGIYYYRNLQTSFGNSYRFLISLSDSITGSLTFSEKKPSHALRIAHKSYTLRKAVSHTSTERNSTRDKCPISNTELCLRKNEVYQLTCSRCNQQYIGITTRFIRDRVSLSENISKREIPLLEKNTSIPPRMKTKKALRSRLL